MTEDRPVGDALRRRWHQVVATKWVYVPDDRRFAVTMDPALGKWRLTVSAFALGRLEQPQDLGFYDLGVIDVAVDTYEAHYPKLGFWVQESRGTRLRHEGVGCTYLADPAGSNRYRLRCYAADGTIALLCDSEDYESISKRTILHYMTTAVEKFVSDEADRLASHKSLNLCGRLWVAWDGRIGRVERSRVRDKPYVLRWHGNMSNHAHAFSAPFYDSAELREMIEGCWMPGQVEDSTLLRQMIEQIQRLTVKSRGGDPSWVKDLTHTLAFFFDIDKYLKRR